MDYTIEKDWITPSGLRAVVVAIRTGHRCGYVAVPKGHPLYELSYSHSELDDIVVHGGLTYSGPSDYPVQDPDLWWFGFDCAHSGDKKDPSIMDKEHKKLYLAGYYLVHESFATIKTTDYCTRECESLAKQLKEAS